MLKKYKWLIILFAVIISLIIIVLVFSNVQNKYLKETNIKEIVNKIEKDEDFILYIKQTDCAHCKEFTPNMTRALKESNLSAYVLNISELDKKDEELYEKTITISGTPTVLFYENGSEKMIRIEGEQTKEKIKEKIETAGFIKKAS